MNRKMVFSAFAAALLVCCGGVLTSCGKNSADGGSSAADDIISEEPAVTEAETEPFVPPVYVECKTSDIHKGNLILVNRDYSYTDINPDLVNIYANMTNSYNVDRSDMELDKTMLAAINSMLDEFASKTGITNVLANSGYRSYDEQKQMYDDDMEMTGLSYSELVAPPGNSEHHTGYAMDFAVDDGYEYPALRNEGEYSWIYDNADRFGMILRYTEQNRHITGYMAESWHFRYIGPVHASLVKRMGVAYEQYIGFLKDFTFENALEYKFSDSEFYKIYYVPASDTEKTEIPIPYEAFENRDNQWEYTISGNNADGFIVTLRIPELSPDFDDSYLYMFSSATEGLTSSDTDTAAVPADAAEPADSSGQESDSQPEPSENEDNASSSDEETGW